jgi:circadian clock protein KaiC
MIVERISSGIKSLDYVLHGGIPSGSSVLVAGNPGTGKTIFANQVIYSNASKDCRVLYLTTMSEPQIKILRYQQEFTFFDIGKFQNSIFYYDLSGTLRKDGTPGVIAYIDELLQKHQPKIVVIDTIRTLTDMIESKHRFREFILDLSVRLTVWDCTSFFLGEYTECEIETRPESAIADGIIYLSGTEERKYQKRFLRILKMRGTSYEYGEIFFKINEKGITLFPRLKADPGENTVKTQGNTRISTGIGYLDGMLGGGIPRNTVTILSGGSGTGKTLMASHYALAGLKNGETVVYATYEENAEQLIAGALSAGIDFRPYIREGKLMLIYVSPVELDMDEHISVIQGYMKETKAQRLVIDSISSFELGIVDKVKYTDYMWSLANYLKTQGVTTLMTHEIHHSIEAAGLTKHGISFIADNLILLAFRETGMEFKRYLRIIKSRSSRHDMLLREYRITDQGISMPTEYSKA